MNTVSPMPLVGLSPGPSDRCRITRGCVRMMIFQSLLTEMGITGWMLRMFCVPLSGPKLKFVLFWERQADEIADRVLCASWPAPRRSSRRERAPPPTRKRRVRRLREGLISIPLPSSSACLGSESPCRPTGWLPPSEIGGCGSSRWV